MYLVPSLPKFEEFAMVSPKFQPCRAANTAARPDDQGRTGTRVDLNQVVTHVAGDVAARVNSASVDIQLKLAPGCLEVNIEEEIVAFVLSGLLVAMVRGLDDEGKGHVRIETDRGREELSATVTTSGVPSIAAVRAVESRDFDGDPTIAHCRRLVEGCGGQLRLADAGGRLGLRVAVPRLSPRSDQAYARELSALLPHTTEAIAS